MEQNIFGTTALQFSAPQSGTGKDGQQGQSLSVPGARQRKDVVFFSSVRVWGCYGESVSTSPMQSESLHHGFVDGHSGSSLPCSWSFLLDSGADLGLSGTTVGEFDTMFEIRGEEGALWVADDVRMERKKKIARIL